MFGKYNGFVSKARVSACMYFLVGDCITEEAVVLEKSFIERIFKYQEQIAPYIVGALVENTLVLVFSGFQKKDDDLYQRNSRSLSQKTLDREIDASLRNQIRFD